MDPTLLVTYAPAHPGKAEHEVRALLDEFESGFEITDATTPGLFLVAIENPKSVVTQLKQLPADSFEMTYKWIPIEEWTPAELPDIAAAVASCSARLLPEDSWRLLLFKRGYQKHDAPTLIKKLTEPITHEKVDLHHPKKLIVVEIIGARAGISLLSSEEYLDVNKKR